VFWFVCLLPKTCVVFCSETCVLVFGQKLCDLVFGRKTCGVFFIHMCGVLCLPISCVAFFSQNMCCVMYVRYISGIFAKRKHVFGPYIVVEHM
jgi:hypothetical protein